MSIEAATMLIRTRVRHIETAANYVKVVDEEDINHACYLPMNYDIEHGLLFVGVSAYAGRMITFQR
jgi:amino-acid N-acetyltransferase